MNCSSIESLISEKLERELTESEILCIENHIKECKECFLYNLEVEEILSNSANVSIVCELEQDKNFNQNIMFKIKEVMATSTYIVTKLTFSLIPMFISFNKVIHLKR